MLNMNLETNINSIPYLLYMQENESADRGNENENQNSFWKECRPPKADNRE